MAYVFVHLLPHLARHQETFRQKAEESSSLLSKLESHTYLIALIGLAVFYGLERLARGSARRELAAGRERRPSKGTFWVHLGSFAIYNVLIGYLLLHREDSSWQGLVIFGIALGLHFLVNDQGLRESHGATYDKQGRWLLAVTPLIGWWIGAATTIPALGVAALFAFLAGGIVLNVLKEELPEERESWFSAFALGAGVYTALLLAIQ
ncbi:hypothetical protein [Microvirga lenta]|uniref:hypothetical protein n=1 Tax=Microvirga lenta TaxID=2881337 RepID=UPI001CFF9A20|nr:hypothetical protein [Microvirga lenta]MCB5175842.1 hypothetical protein [Microvirga lenta]